MKRPGHISIMMRGKRTISAHSDSGIAKGGQPACMSKLARAESISSLSRSSSHELLAEIAFEVFTIVANIETSFHPISRLKFAIT